MKFVISLFCCCCYCLFVFVFLLIGKAEWDDNPVCWWLGLYFCFVCCLNGAFCTVCYWWLGDAGSCIQVVSFVWVLTIWYSLGLVLWSSRVLESVLLLPRLRAWSLVRNKDSTSGFFMALSEIKTNNPKKETKDAPQTNGSYKISQIRIKIMEYTRMHIHP